MTDLLKGNAIGVKSFNDSIMTSMKSHRIDPMAIETLALDQFGR